MKLSIIIPAYNEERRILSTLQDYYNFFNKKFKNNFEIIIVPNNCSDNTFKVVSDFSKNKKQIKIFNISHYSGKGGAVMKGFELAEGEYIGFTDADNSTNPENFYKLYQNIGNYQGAIASRRIKGALVSPKRKLTQNISSFMFNKIAKILFGFKYSDTQCGAKLFEKNIAKFLNENFSEKGWIFDIDLLYLCKKNKLIVYENPIIWRDAEGSKLSFKDGIFSILKLFKYRLRIKN
jgi:dolichol-phosphate mannosyltransferase